MVANEPPWVVVLPAAPRSLKEGLDMTFDASGSTDDVAIVSFRWELPGGYIAADLGITPADQDTDTLPFTAPMVSVDELLVFVLTVTDDEGAATVVDVEVTATDNLPPVAAIDPAGPIDVGRNQALQIQGSGSYDPDGTIVSYAWTLPGGSVPGDFGLTGANLSDIGFVITTPSAATGTPLTFTLEVTDDDGVTDQATLDLTVVNNAPVVMLWGEDTTPRTFDIERSTWISLDFSDSFDPDGDNFFFNHSGTIIDCQADFGTNFAVDSTSVSFWLDPDPADAACQGATLTLEVEADDGLLTSTPLAITFNVLNAPPNANIQPGDQVLDPGNSLTFDGSSSSDPDPADTITFAWQVISASDPSVDCASDWAASDPTLDTLDVTAPAAASDPECAIAVSVELTVEDDWGAQGSDGRSVRVGGGAGSTRQIYIGNRELAHGKEFWAYANLDPDAVSGTVDYVWTVAVVSGSCVAGDLTITEDTEGLTYGSAYVAAAVGATGCVFEVTVEATLSATGEVVTTTFLVTVVNSPPVVSIAGAVETAPGIWEMTIAPATIAQVVTTVSDPNGFVPPIDFTWSGDLAAAICTPSCAGSLTAVGDNPLVLIFNGTQIAGMLYSIQLTADDGDLVTNVDLNIMVEPCLYVSTSPGGSPDGTLAEPFGSIQQALDIAAAASEQTNVCVLAGTYPEEVVLAAGANSSPTLSGGFDAAGLPIAAGRRDQTVILVSQAEGVRFASGADNRLEYLTVMQDPALFAVEAAALTIRDASPTLSNVVVNGGAGDPAIGVDIVAETANTEPLIQSSRIVASDRLLANDVIGVRVRQAGATVLPLIQLGTISVGIGAGHGVGVEIGSGADAILEAVAIDDQEDWSHPDHPRVRFVTIAGVEAIGTAGNPASFALLDSQISLYNDQSEDAFGVYLERTAGVEIAGNNISGQAGQRVGFGIADGNVFIDGTTSGGGSTNLAILDNPWVRGMGPWPWGNPPCVGATRFGVGVLLVGTSDVLIAGNHGTTGGGGIAGGRAVFHFDDSTERVPPIAAGLWLLDATNVEIIDTVIQSGMMFGNSLCSIPNPLPPMIGLLDGMPGGLGAGPSRSTAGLSVDRSAVLCSFMAENAIGSLTACVGADLQGSADATFTNSILSAYNTNFNQAVRLTEGSGVDLVNNYLELDFDFAWPPPPPNSIRKWGVVADRIGANALRAYNNIIYIRRDDPYDHPDERLALREIVAGSTNSSIEDFTNNLMFVEDDLVSSTGAPVYMRVINAAAPGSPAEYTASGVNSVAGMSVVQDNLVDEVMILDNWSKDQIRLDPDPSNPAIDAARADVAPPVDIDGDARPSGGADDIGHDEVP